MIFSFKIIIENKRAIGVEVEIKGKTHIVKASQEVLLSAGTIGSAQLLMLSGIGPKDHLREMGVSWAKTVKNDVPLGKDNSSHSYFI